MGKYLDIIDATYDINDINDKRVTPKPKLPPFGRLNRLCRTFAELEQRCPDFVDVIAWQIAVEDGHRFLAKWGAQAERLGWTADDLFGLHEPPANPHPSYSPLARLDCVGLIWVLSGRAVIALTGAAATIRATAGNLTWRRRSCAQSRRSPSHDLRQNQPEPAQKEPPS